MGKLIQARDRGEPIPADALTKEGDHETDPALAESCCRLDGPKGSGLAFMFDADGHARQRSHHTQTGRPGAKRTHTANAMMALIDVAVFARSTITSATWARSDAGEALPKADGVKEVLLPASAARANSKSAGARGSQFRKRPGAASSKPRRRPASTRPPSPTPDGQPRRPP